MAAEGQVVIRIYNFDPLSYRIGPIGFYLEPSPAYGEPSAVYVSDLQLNEVVINIPWAYVDTATGFWILNADIPPGTDVIEIEFTPIIGGAPQPIDPFDPPEWVNVVFNNSYAGGVVELGVYLGGQYAALGSTEFTHDDFTGVRQIELYPAVAPQISAFWTDFIRTRELVEGTVIPPPKGPAITPVQFPPVEFGGTLYPPRIIAAASDGGMNAVLICHPTLAVGGRYVLCTEDGGVTYTLRELPCMCAHISYTDGMFILSGSEQNPFAPAVVTMASPSAPIIHIPASASGGTLHRVGGPVKYIDGTYVGLCAASGTFAGYSHNLSNWSLIKQFDYVVPPVFPVEFGGYMWWADETGAVYRSADGISMDLVATQGLSVSGGGWMYSAGGMLHAIGMTPDFQYVPAHSADGVEWVESPSTGDQVFSITGTPSFVLYQSNDGAFVWDGINESMWLIDDGGAVDFSRSGSAAIAGVEWVISNTPGEIVFVHREGDATPPTPVVIYP